MAEPGDGPNHHAFGTFVMPPAFAGVTPKAGGDRSSQTFAKKYRLTAIWHTSPKCHDSRHRVLHEIGLRERLLKNDSRPTSSVNQC